MTVPRRELVTAVAVASPDRTRWCDSCMSSDGFEADVFAMLPSGLQQIGLFQGCDRCDPDGRIVCFYCAAPFVGGAAFWHHLHRSHGEAGG